MVLHRRGPWWSSFCLDRSKTRPKCPEQLSVTPNLSLPYKYMKIHPHTSTLHYHIILSMYRYVGAFMIPVYLSNILICISSISSLIFSTAFPMEIVFLTPFMSLTTAMKLFSFTSLGPISTRIGTPCETKKHWLLVINRSPVFQAVVRISQSQVFSELLSWVVCINIIVHYLISFL